MSASFERKLNNYAELLVRKGVNIRPGQRLHLTCPVEAAELGRRVADAAYRFGAKLVEVHWVDDAVTLSRFANAKAETFDEIPTARADAVIKGVARGDALLAIHAADPSLLKDQNPELVAKVQRMTQEYLQAYSASVMANKVNWCVASAAIGAWARQVFPEAPAGEQVARLWDAIFAATRADLDDPIAAWNQHVADLAARRAYLNERQFDALRYTGPGTDLTLGLPRNHVWMGGTGLAADGEEFIANLPTEEVFTLPHRERAEGTVASTRPLSYAGTLIDDFSLTFAGGKVVGLKARDGEDTLRRLVETDEGSARLGEVALVPHGSPISASGILFYNTLFDENASCHVAIGKAYPKCLDGGTEMSAGDLKAAGANHSLAHVDFMIGSDQLDIDGLSADGQSTPLMRAGEWA
ncbi:MAG: aminopeptidase [Gemmatimonadota bacterium]|nr:MAG: aminopeptidase [Gemmatimonadota bacterium]